MNEENTTQQFLPKSKHHHIPTWLRKAIRLYMIKTGEWEPCVSSEFQWLCNEFRDIFDHWGSYKTEFGEVVYAQPYCHNDVLALHFSIIMDCTLIKLPIGFHHPNTVLYLFAQKP
jgi:hypothetical protein